MSNALILKLLLSFCDNVQYQHACEYDMVTCFGEKTSFGFTGEEAFHICLDESYDRRYDGKYGYTLK